MVLEARSSYFKVPLWFLREMTEKSMNLAPPKKNPIPATI
jgi:hypothetical protein